MQNTGKHISRLFDEQRTSQDMSIRIVANEAPTDETDSMSADSMSEHEELSNNSEPPVDLSGRLRQTAFRATKRLNTIRRRHFSVELERLLSDLERAMDANAVHLFEVGTPRNQSTTAIMRSRSDITTRDSSHSLRFPIRILPQRIRACLESDSIVSLPAGSNAAGRVVSGLIKVSDADAYLLCPLHQGRRFRGLLGIARRAGETEFTDQELELLRLNGAILLNHVIRHRKDRKRQKKLRQWKRVASQSCDFAVTIDSRQQVIKTTPFDDPSVAGELDGLRLIDFVARNFHRDLRELLLSSVAEQQPRSCDLQVSFGHEGPRWYHVHIDPGEQDGPNYANLFFTDNTADKMLEEQVRELQESLIKASRLSLLGQMSTEFSHQLNQPCRQC